MADPASMERMLDAWRRVADDLVWATPYRELFVADPPYDDWFVGGELNLAVNCVDRHLATRGDQVAIHWEGEPGDRRAITFRELHAEVVALSRALRGLGTGRGDRVALHLGWLPETVVAMLACARIGAEYTLIPVPLPVEALAQRLDDFNPRVLFTQDGGWRHGAILPLKARSDEALEAASGVEHTVVVRRTGVHVTWFEGDKWYHELVDAETGQGEDVDPEPVPADHTVTSAYLANRRGRALTVRHGTANLAVAALAVHRHGVAAGDVYWCVGDLAWLGAQAHGVFGPLLDGCRTVMYEGTLDVPSPDRLWSVVERYGVTSLLTSPSVVRSLRTWSSAAPAGSTASLLRITTIGERLDDELRDWLAGVIGEQVTVADGWGQVELSGVVAIDQPVAGDRLPDPGFVVLDEAGAVVPPGTTGEWVMLRPWPGMMRSAEEPGSDSMASHWHRHPGHYASGDLARRDESGRLEFLGRMDEVVSVSGQLVSLTEVRDVLLEQPFVSHAEVFVLTDPRLGHSVGAAVVLHPGAPAEAEAIRELQDAVRDLLGGLSRPRTMVLVDRFGHRLDVATCRRALAALAVSGTDEPLRVTWEQVVAAAGQ